MPNKFDKKKQKDQSYRAKLPKDGRGGKGTWGNAMDDVEFMHNPPPAAIDEHDPNYEEPSRSKAVVDEEEAFAVDLWEAEGREQYFADLAADEEPVQKTVQTVADVIANTQLRLREYLDQVLAEELSPGQFYEKMVLLRPENLNCDIIFAASLIDPQLLQIEKDRETLADLVAVGVRRNLLKRNILEDEIYSTLASILDTEHCSGVLAYTDLLAENGAVSKESRAAFGKLEGLENPEEFRKNVKSKVKATMKEYFSSGELDEAIRSIKELELGFFHYEAVKTLINLAMDESSKCRELASELLGHEGVFSRIAVRQGFKILLERLDDLNKDVPDATDLVACFISRAVSDESMAPSFVPQMRNQLCRSPTALQCLQKIQHLLSMKYSAQRLSRVWGPGRSLPVDELKVSIKEMLKEFFVTKNLNELATCLKDLEEPNYHHEFVKQSIVRAADLKPEHVDLMIDMLSKFVDKELITFYQLRLAFARLENGMDNYKIDTPNLVQVFSRVKEQVTEPVKEVKA